jgi:type I restriction enzyme S subunit
MKERLLEDVFEFIRNGASIKQSEGKQGCPITRIETIWNKTIDNERFGFADIFENDLSKYQKYLMRKGDILMSHINSPKHLGKSAIYKGKPELLLHGMNLLALRPNTAISFPQYLSYYLNSKLFKVQLPKISNQSVNQASFSSGKLKKLSVPLPPLEQQKKIAAILDAADIYRQKTKALITKYDELTQSLFLDMFGDTVSNPKGWKTKTIEQLVKKQKYSLKRGPFGGALKKEIFVKDGYLVYEQYHALNNDFSMARYFIDEKKYKELIGFAVNPKDIIISCSGVYLGKLAIIPENAREGIINQALLKVTLDESKIRNDFFVFHFTQQNFKQKYFDSNRGAGVPNFPPMKVFKQFPFISPPIELQNKFAERIQAIEVQKTQAQDSLAQAEDLFNSLLQRAFKGDLV